MSRIKTASQLSATVAISEISKVIAGVFDMRELLDSVVSTLAGLSRADACSIWLIDNDGKLRIKAAEGYHKPLLGAPGKDSHTTISSAYKRGKHPPIPAEYELGEGVTGRIAKKGKTVRTTSTARHSKHPEWKGRYDTVQWSAGGDIRYQSKVQKTCKTFFGCALKIRETILGILKVENKRNPDGSLAEAFTQEDEEVFTILANVIGVTIENQRLAEERQRQEEEAWRLVSARLAHKIGNQNFALKILLQDLETYTDNKRPVSECLRCCRSIDIILTEATEFATQPTLQKEDCNLKELIDSVIEAHPTVEWDAKILHDCQDPDLTLPVDRDKLRHVLMELLENSQNFKEKGAVVNIRTGRSTQEMLEKQGLQGAHCHIEYRDNGPGIPADKKEAVFEPFVSLRHGSGLGLSIIRQMIDAHGGKITECGHPGEGVRFLIFLPLLPKRREE